MSLVKTGFRYILTVCLIGLVSLGVHDYLQNFDPNECSMTYMMQSPNLIPINLRPEISQNYSNYKLFLYCEGEQCSRNENIDFRTPGAIPVLFVTGNADSHLQVRSIASVALAKSFKSQQNRFLFFTISFNEELNAIYGKFIFFVDKKYQNKKKVRPKLDFHNKKRTKNTFKNLIRNVSSY